MTVDVTNHAGVKMPTAGAKGGATILSGKLKASAALQPGGDNRLKGVAKYAATPETKVVVSATLAGEQAEQARFTPFAAAREEHKH